MAPDFVAAIFLPCKRRGTTNGRWRGVVCYTAKVAFKLCGKSPLGDGSCQLEQYNIVHVLSHVIAEKESKKASVRKVGSTRR